MSKRLARISYVLLSFYIPLWLLADAIEPNALNFLLIACSALCMYRISQEPRLRNWVLFGGLVGLQILLRPDMLVGAVFCAGWFTITLYRKVGLARLTKWFVVTSVVALAIVLPWTLRNYVVFHRFVLVSANGGYNLWIGNNSSADGELHYASRDRESQLQEDSVHAFAMTHDAVAYDSLYKAFAIYNIISHPMRTMRVDAMKLYYHWWRRQNVGDWNGVNRFILYFDVVSFLLLLFGFLGLIVLKNRQARNLILTFFLYSSTVSVIFFVQTRHRVLKVDPFLIPLAVAGCYTLVERVRGRKYLSAKLADSLRPEPHLSLDQRLAARR